MLSVKCEGSSFCHQLLLLLMLFVMHQATTILEITMVEAILMEGTTIWGEPKTIVLLLRTWPSLEKSDAA